MRMRIIAVLIAYSNTEHFVAFPKLELGVGKFLTLVVDEAEGSAIARQEHLNGR